MREQGVVLEDHPDAALVRRDVVDRLAIQQDFTVRCGLKPRKHHQAGGFAGPRRAEHRQKLAFADREVKIFDDERFAIITFLYAIKDHETVFGRGGQNSSPVFPGPICSAT